MNTCATERRQPIVVDTDMGADDFMALLLLLQNREQVDVKAITVTGTGLSHLDPGTQSALDLLLLGGQPEIPVAKGVTTPLIGNATFPESWRRASDDRFGIALPENRNPPSSLDAVELLISTIMGSPHKPIVVALGPLTNLALAMMAQPRLSHYIESIYIMGGAVNVGGNVHTTWPKDPNTVAEWNFYIDPKAADVVLHSGAPITLVPLDVTRYAKVTKSFLERLGREAKSPATRFVYQLLQAQQGSIDDGTYDFWDPLAASLAMNRDFATYANQEFRVACEGGPVHYARVLGQGPNQLSMYGQSMTPAQVRAFEDYFIELLNR